MKIVIVEDHLVFREILRKVCARDLRHAVVATGWRFALRPPSDGFIRAYAGCFFW